MSSKDRPADIVLGSDGSGRASGISDIAWDACGQPQSRAVSDRVPPAIRTTAHQCRHTGDAAPPLTTDAARALLSVKERRTV